MYVMVVCILMSPCDYSFYFREIKLSLSVFFSLRAGVVHFNAGTIKSQTQLVWRRATNTHVLHMSPTVCPSHTHART